MALTPPEIERYKRHLVLRQVGGQGQQKLKAARVLVVGAGGLGSPVLMYLAAAGVGTLGIIDDDRVSLDNLQRQIVHDTSRVGVAKVESARETIAAAQSACRGRDARRRGSMRATRSRSSRATTSSPTAPTTSPTRYLVSDACYLARKPLVFAAVGPFDGYLTTFKPHEKGAGRQALSELPLPLSRRRRRPAPSPTAPRSACSAPPSAWSARLQATEVMKEILGLGETPGRPAADLRREGDALQRDRDRLGPGQSADRAPRRPSATCRSTPAAASPTASA